VQLVLGGAIEIQDITRYNKSMNDTPDYDLAFSFAGENRDYVEQTKIACEELGLKVFYDKDKNNEWWGKNFIREQRKVYGSKTRHFVPFISPEYFVKSIPSDEFESALMTAVERGDDYILPVIIGRPVIPADRLHRHTHYLRAEKYTPKELAQEMYERIRGGNIKPAKDIAVMVNDAAALKMPKVTPRTFSKYREIETTLEFLGDSFEKALHRLENETDFLGTVRKKDDAIIIRIEHSSKTVYALNIFQGGMGRDDSIGFNLDSNGLQRNSYHATATPYFDKEAGQAKLEILNLSLLESSARERLTKEELFTEIWKKLIQQIESTVN
jgi:hypothetical protein